MGNQHGKERSYGRRIDWANAEKPSPPGKPYLVPDLEEQESDFITIRWAPPVSDGGAPILGYVVEHRRTGSPHWLRAIPYLAVETKLTLTGLEPGWRYQFRVSAENDIGRSPPGEVSEVLTVTSQKSAATSPHFNVELRDLVALENEKVEFTVHVVAIPQAKISWYKDGFEVFSSRRMKIVTENDQSTFIIHQAALEDEGEIKCTATNRAGHSVTKAVLKLEAPPRIRLPRQYEDGLLFEKGELIRLKVSTAGRPPPRITWYHNGELLQNDDKYEILDADRSSSLRISEAQREDRGEYQIRGENKIGEDIVSFLVTVTDRPMPPGKPQVAMALGRSVTLSWVNPDDDGGCKIGSYIVEYYRMGWNMWLKAATCRQLNIVLSDLIEGSEYKFRVKAENPYGVSDPSEESDVVFIPDPKRGILEPPPRKDAPDIDHWMDGIEEAERKDAERRTMLEENARKLLDTPLPLDSGTLKPAEEQGIKRSLREGSNPPPVPKRRHRGERQRNTPSPNIVKNKNPMEQEEAIPREKDHTMFHGSSELMLVLLPEERSKSAELSAQQRSEIEMSLIGPGIAPPMSLSAPELGSNQEVELPPMRDAVSSSELLHEMAMARLYQDVLEEESQTIVKRRYSGDRRSVERRSGLRESNVLERRHSFKQNDDKIVVTGLSPNSELDKKLKVPDSKRISLEEREEMEFALVRGRRFKKREEKPQHSSGEEEEEDEYLDDEEELTDEEMGMAKMSLRAPKAEEEDDTCLAVTSRIVLPRLEITLPVIEEPIATKEKKLSPEPENDTEVKEEAEVEEEEEPLKVPVKRGRAAKLLKKLGLRRGKKVPEIIVEEDISGSPLPRPILKHQAKKKGRSRTESEKSTSCDEISDDGLPGRKKKQVRIAEPDSTGATSSEEKPVEEEEQGQRVLIYHYSDIVREYGYGKKPPTKQYLSRDDLKAVAVEATVRSSQSEEVKDTSKPRGEDKEDATSIPTESREPPAKPAPNANVLEASSDTKILPVQPKVRTSLDYVTDIAMFLIACWLYLFKNELYAVPILCLMAYRQVKDAAKAKYVNLKESLRNRKKN